jgi:hypothetical protein
LRIENLLFFIGRKSGRWRSGVGLGAGWRLMGQWVVVWAEKEVVPNFGEGGAFVFVELAMRIAAFQLGGFFFLAEVAVFGEEEGGAADASERVEETSVI